MRQVSSVVTISQTGILGKTRGRGERRLPDWSNVIRSEATVNLEVGPSYVATIIGSDWCGYRMSELKDPLFQICTYGKMRLLRFRLPHQTYPWGGALSRFSAVLRKSINRAERQDERGRISRSFDRDSISERQSHRDQDRRWGRGRDQGCCRSRR